MSTLVISALAAAAFATVPPSIGSEPVPVGFDHVAGPAQHVAFEAPSLAASLGSEPLLPDPGAEAPATKPGQRSPGHATLAASLGSEPFLVGGDEMALPAVPAGDRARSGELVACRCPCR